MAKPMLVSLPFVLLLLDYWPLRRIPASLSVHSTGGKAVDRLYIKDRRALLSKLLLEKIPFISLAALSGILTIMAAKGYGSVATLEALSFWHRISNAFVSYLKYMLKALWPADLAFFYPHPLHTLSLWPIAGSFLALAAISLGVIRLKKDHPYLLVGWLWYLVTLGPVIGLIQVGEQAMADRYAYVPFIGLFIIAAWGIPDLLSHRPYRKTALALTAGLVLSTSAILTFSYLDYWKNSVSLFKRALNVTSGNYVAHFHLGNALAREGRTDEAIHEFRRALEIKPDHAPSHCHLGIALTRKGEWDEAIAHYSKALKINPRDAEVYYSLGNAFNMQGRLDEASSHYAQALRLDPNNARAHNNLGFVLLRRGEPDKALNHFREALRIDPGDKKARHNLAIALGEMEKQTP
jgi:Flp pilus assembly protein TadD